MVNRGIRYPPRGGRVVAANNFKSTRGTLAYNPLIRANLKKFEAEKRLLSVPASLPVIANGLAVYAGSLLALLGGNFSRVCSRRDHRGAAIFDDFLFDCAVLVLREDDPAAAQDLR